MRVALLQFYSSRPTPEYVQIAGNLCKQGHQAWVATPDDDGDLVWKEGERVISTLSGSAKLMPSFAFPGARRFADLRFILSVRQFLRQNCFDIVQVNPASVHWVWLLPLLMPKGMGFILDWRQIGERPASGSLGKLKRSWFYLRRRLYSRQIYDCAVFLHWAGAQRVLGDQWQRWAKVVPMGVDTQFLDAQRPQSPALNGNEAGNGSGYGPSNGKVRILYIGSINRVRQLELLLDAAKELQADALDFELVFLGRDSSPGYYPNLAHQLELDDVVTFLPPVPYPEVPETVLSYDAALAYVPAEPADWKYHPTLKVLEYRALGIPIIATNFLPNLDEVEDGVNGLLAENTVTDFAAAMQRFIDDSEFLEDCTINAQHMRKGLSWAEVATRYEQEVYRTLGRQS